MTKNYFHKNFTLYAIELFVFSGQLFLIEVDTRVFVFILPIIIALFWAFIYIRLVGLQQIRRLFQKTR